MIACNWCCEPTSRSAVLPELSDPKFYRIVNLHSPQFFDDGKLAACEDCERLAARVLAVYYLGTSHNEDEGGGRHVEEAIDALCTMYGFEWLPNAKAVA